MDMKINNLEHEGTKYRGRLKGIAYDAATQNLTAVAAWRASGTFKKADVSAPTLSALAVKAVEVITGPPA